MNTLFESLTGLKLLDPWMLGLLAMVPLAVWHRRRRGGPAILFAAGELASGHQMPRSWRVRWLPVPRVLQVSGLVLLVLALARPVERVRLPLEKQGIDIFLCIDASSSMAAYDMHRRYTRLDLAQDAAAQFIAGRPDDRIGLISFARYPDLLCPLTLDHDALTRMLGDLEMVERDGPEDLTGVGTAVARAAQALTTSEAKSKVVILLTDGVENVATSETPGEIGPLKAAQLCIHSGVRVYTIAAGEGTRDRAGNWVRIDTEQVESMARATGGEFFEARNAASIAGVYGFVDLLEKAQLEEPRYKHEERFSAFLLAALTMLLGSRLLRSSVWEVLP